MTIRIRDGSEADVDGIARVHVQGWRESYVEFLTPEALAGLSVEERAAMWRGILAKPDPQARLLVAEMPEGEIVGFGRGGPAGRKGPGLLGTETEIYALYLLDRVKRQGVGRRLLAGIFEHLAAQGFRSAGLWVLKENAPARRFYEALGGAAGPEQSFDLRGQQVTEVAYRFDLTGR
ncbi:GNAT family N-acetyltransferase [Microvirga subterranea]|uniref:L-amino acid N-acyltransferase YncA n=1 Tax=Microvirga subterranea TaxID=186651 RepID=A0A370HLM2_9HYPH|nr:GNAT family N-acetyltransferase [Microvirga subterranea]RDI59399.1 L-amino acid N-acyltransferase YncA [Microvirga subterranea]